MYLPAGHYTLEKMIKVLNLFVDEYDMVFVIQDGGRVGVKFNPFPTYVYNYLIGQDGRTFTNQMSEKKPWP